MRTVIDILLASFFVVLPITIVFIIDFLTRE